MAADIPMATQARTVFATINAHGLEENIKAVRFAGENFGDLKARLAAANLPGLNEDSFFEVKLGEEFVCLLDSEVLPSGDIHIRVFTLPTGNGWHKPVDSPQEFYTEQYGPYHYGHHHHGDHCAEVDSHGFGELGKENCTEKRGKKGKHAGKGHSHSRARSRGRSHSPGHRRSHSPRCRGMRGRHTHHGRHGPGGPHCGPHSHHRGMRRGMHHHFGMHHGPGHFGIHFHGPPGIAPHFAQGMPPFPGSQCPACNSGRGEGEPSASAAAKEMAEEVAGLALVSSITGDN